MKKSFFLQAICISAIALFVGCASTPKEPRSIKIDSKKVNTAAKAKLVADNWELTQIVYWDKNHEEGNLPGFLVPQHSIEEIFVAQNENTGDNIVFLLAKADGIDSEVQFSYVDLAGEKSSSLKQILELGTVYLHNTSTSAELDSGTHEILPGAYNALTTRLAKRRVSLKSSLERRFKIKFDEPINEKQSEITGLIK